MASLHPRDPLTRLPGRGALLSELRRLQDSALLVVADLDGMTDLNAQQGTQAGDAVLREVAAVLSLLVGPTRLHRTGDDEFGWLLDPAPDDPTGYVEDVAAIWLGGAQPIGARFGWVLAEPGDGLDLAFGRAVAAARAARKSPNRVAGFTPFDAVALRRQQAVAHALADALREGGRQFHLLYQPIRRLQDGALVAVETLARWEHPTLGVIAPDEFVPLAEHSGLATDLDRWVVAHALATAPSLAGAPQVHVNVSAASLSTPGFASELLDLVGHAGTTPDRLCVELTETALAASSTRLRQALTTLHAQGIAISLDDFGTGHASWSYLSQLPFDEVKLDKSYVQRLPDDAYQLAVVRAILEVARARGQRVVAEGVETPEQARALLAIGCELGQGYLLGRAEPHVGTAPPPLAPTAPEGSRRRGHAAVTGESDPAQQLTDLAQALSASPPDAESVFRVALAALRRALDFDGGSLQLVGRDGVRLAAADPAPPPEAFTARLPAGHGVAGTVLGTGRPVYLPDITLSPAVPTRKRAISGGVRSYLAVPLFQKGKPVGVLQIDSTDVDAFDAEARLLLAAAAPLVAAALRLRRLAAVPVVADDEA